MSVTTIKLDGGKYTVNRSDDGRMWATRYSEPWRELTGDNLIYWLCVRIEELEASRSQDARMLADAAYLIRMIGSTGVERTDVIQRAEEWGKKYDEH